MVREKTPVLRRRIVVVHDDPDLRGILLERLTYRWYREEIPELTGSS
jgi:hypothetical protein